MGGGGARSKETDILVYFGKMGITFGQVIGVAGYNVVADLGVDLPASCGTVRHRSGSRVPPSLYPLCLHPFPTVPFPFANCIRGSNHQFLPLGRREINCGCELFMARKCHWTVSGVPLAACHFCGISGRTEDCCDGALLLAQPFGFQLVGPCQWRSMPLSGDANAEIRPPPPPPPPPPHPPPPPPPPPHTHTLCFICCSVVFFFSPSSDVLWFRNGSYVK